MGTRFRAGHQGGSRPFTSLLDCPEGEIVLLSGGADGAGGPTERYLGHSYLQPGSSLLVPQVGREWSTAGWHLKERTVKDEHS